MTLLPSGFGGSGVLVALLLPMPFLLSMFTALLWPKNNGRSPRWLGYVGSAAGVVTLLLLLQIWHEQTIHATTAWFTAAGLTIPLTLLVDNVSMLLVAIVAGIGAIIFFYSVGYLEPEEDLRRYYAALSLFAAAMIGVVISGNLIQLFFAWELVGLSSYLLIGFWHQKESAIAAARKAFLTIIVGDAFLLSGILLLWYTYGTFDIPTLLGAAHATPLTIIAGVCIIIGAISKSAQFPLHAWLPDAMEGPTPVSAFLHSATMVKAGLFLIIRMLPLLVICGLSPLLIEIAAITIIISAICALVENDIKRVLAYSTMNQLGFILLAIGVGATTAGLYHLLNHSIFKALLFLCAGAIIHLAGTQDITQMNMKLGNNLLAICTGIGALALAGLPIFIGFFSKDAIFDAIVKHGNIWLLVLFCAAVLLSSLYIFRWYFLIFRPTGFMEHINFEMRAPLPVLAFLCVVGGLIMPAFYARFGEQLPSIGAALPVAIASTVLVCAGLVFAYLAYRKATLASTVDRCARSGLSEAARKRFFVDNFQGFLADCVAAFARFVSRIDGGINRTLDLVAFGMKKIGGGMRRLIDGSPAMYAGGVLLGFILIALLLRFT